VAATPESPVVDVVCGVIWSRDGRYLLAQRPKGRIWDGYWEFPGGKIEPGETAAAAIARELEEELGVAVTRADPWLLKVFDYPHARVRLHFFHIREWSGEPACLEGQALYWQTPGAVCEVGPLLPANAPILRALDMPALLLVTPAPEVAHRAALERVSARLARFGRPSATSWLQVRRGELTAGEWQDWTALCTEHRMQAVANTSLETAFALGATAVHVNSDRLASLDQRPDLPLVGASAHSREEIDRAADLGLDYVILGSVKMTASHPGRAGLGWYAWSDLARWAALPVYAIGGLTPDDLSQAHASGATGIAMINGAWAADDGVDLTGRDAGPGSAD
jgi:8-oxo-dGTP diphosphatase